jgi:hypothetical protein
MNTRKKNASLRRRYVEQPLLPPESRHTTHEIVAAFCVELLAKHERARHMEEEAENGYREARETRNALVRVGEVAEMQGWNHHDEREPLAYLETEIVHLRGLLFRIADYMGIRYTGELLTSGEAATLTDAVVKRWLSVTAAAARHGWPGTDGLPEEHLDAEVSRWKARALTSEQDAEHFVPRSTRPIRSQVGD